VIWLCRSEYSTLLGQVHALSIRVVHDRYVRTVFSPDRLAGGSGSGCESGLHESAARKLSGRFRDHIGAAKSARVRGLCAVDRLYEVGVVFAYISAA
jgi:hypothetical protein